MQDNNQLCNTIVLFPCRKLQNPRKQKAPATMTKVRALPAALLPYTTRNIVVVFGWQRCPYTSDVMQLLEDVIDGVLTYDEIKFVELSSSTAIQSGLQYELEKSIGKESCAYIFIAGEYFGGYSNLMDGDIEALEKRIFQAVEKEIKRDEKNIK